MVIKTCRVCGKEYEACHTLKKGNTFRWQDVACCPEHGAQYLHDVLVARGELEESPLPSDNNVAAEAVEEKVKERKATRKKKDTDQVVEKAAEEG